MISPWPTRLNGTHVTPLCCLVPRVRGAEPVPSLSRHADRKPAEYCNNFTRKRSSACTGARWKHPPFPCWLITLAQACPPKLLRLRDDHIHYDYSEQIFRASTVVRENRNCSRPVLTRLQRSSRCARGCGLSPSDTTSRTPKWLHNKLPSVTQRVLKHAPPSFCWPPSSYCPWSSAGCRSRTRANRHDQEGKPRLCERWRQTKLAWTASNIRLEFIGHA